VSPRIVLGVSGGIAAYKAAELTRALIKAGAEVRVILTARAEAFVTPLTLATLSGHPVLRDEFTPVPTPTIGHIELARWGSVLVVAPATANVIARLAHGLADDLLTTVALAFRGPVVIAPAMNPRMWDHAETRANRLRLAAQGVVMIEPEAGLMACGDEGSGRLATIDRIVTAALQAGTKGTSLAGKTVVVTAGPTFEPLDPVRFVGNRSSGRMGYEIAAAARARSARTILISGPTALDVPWSVERVLVETTEQMRQQLDLVAAQADVIVMSAAIADHRPAPVAGQKLAHKGKTFELTLEPNPDLLSELVRRRAAGQLIVGFAAETADVIAKGVAKRGAKGCDVIIANDVTESGSGFGTDTNRVHYIDEAGVESWPLASKREVAERLWDKLITRLAPVSEQS
jgi:phosphopantothenoylcysteine decarboxylase/phosphopantothenate--cysteine ligase